MKRTVLIAAFGLLLIPTSAQAATSYCLSGTMADGTQVRRGSLAHNGYRLGTRVWVTPRVFGRHRWTVRDRIGWGSEADFWTGSCATAIQFGRRSISVTAGWRGWEARYQARVRARR